MARKRVARRRQVIASMQAPELNNVGSSIELEVYEVRAHYSGARVADVVWRQSAEEQAVELGGVCEDGE